MQLTPKTTILTLVREYPFLIENLAQRNNAFGKLRNPVLRQTMGRVATIDKAAAMGKEDPLELMLFIAGRIMTATGSQVEIVPPEVQNKIEPLAVLTDEQRMEALKGILQELHNGADLEPLKKKFEQTVGDISPDEIAALEQSLVADGIPETEIKRMCNLHVDLFQGALEDQEKPSMPSGHPVHTYMEENNRATEITINISKELTRMGDAPDDNIWSFSVSNLRSMVIELSEIFTHYVRKENQLFPILERHGIEAPPKVMWEVHDDTRANHREVEKQFASDDRKQTIIAIREFAKSVDDMIIKEDMILFPMAIERFSDEDWARARLGDDEIGYAFGITPGNEWIIPNVTIEQTNDTRGTTGNIPLSTGTLPLEVVNLMLCNLPVDMSFVDADDKVAYYSDSSHRLFPRSPEVIGRDVKNCHPQKSVHMVEEILKKFKTGERNSAEFWLELGGKFIHISYMALRASDGSYLGCLEVGQDATHLRSLEGERRLLEWD